MMRQDDSSDNEPLLAHGQEISGHLVSLSSSSFSSTLLSWSVQFHTPASNKPVRRRTYDPPWHLSSFLSQMCKHYYPWVILSGVVKIRSSSSPDTHHQNTTSGGGDRARGRRRSEAGTGGDGGGRVGWEKRWKWSRCSCGCWFVAW